MHLAPPPSAYEAAQGASNMMEAAEAAPPIFSAPTPFPGPMVGTAADLTNDALQPTPYRPEEFHAPTVQGERLPFDLQFQTKAIAIMMRQPGVLADHIDYIQPGYFESAVHRYVVKVMFAYYKKFKTPPTLAAIEVEIVEECVRLKHSEALKEQLLEVARAAAEADLAESKWITKRMIDFAKKSAAKQIAIDLVTMIQTMEAKGEGDFDKIGPQIRKLAAIGATGGRGTDLNEGIENLPKRLQEGSMYSRGWKVPLGLRGIDWSIDGGMSAGEIVFICAPPGAGKSTLLVGAAAAAIDAECNVMIFTMELKEDDYELRLHQRMTGVGKQHIIQNSMRYADRLPWMRERTNKVHVKIKYYPPNTATVDVLRSYFSRVKAESPDNGRPWVIILDYVEKLRMGDPEKVQTWELIGMVVDDLIAFGYEYGAPVVTASQINRQGYAKVSRSDGRKHTSKEDIASSWKKVEAADIVLMFDQSELEKANGVARLRVEKCRRGKDGYTVSLRDERPIMNLVELDFEKQPINAYAPRRHDDEGILELRPAWDNVAPYPDETATGSLRPPQMEIDEFLMEKLESIRREKEGVDFEESYREVESRVGLGTARGSGGGMIGNPEDNVGAAFTHAVAPLLNEQQAGAFVPPL